MASAHNKMKVGIDFSINELVTLSGTVTNPNQVDFTDDRDGKVYSYIQIGNQFWMAENLAYKTTKGYWVYDNLESNTNTYGYLYDWEIACSVCPDGWHLPSVEELDSLINNLGGRRVAGGKMKRTGTYYWNSPNTGATNMSGFTALPGGLRYSSEGGWFDGMGDFGQFWTSSEDLINNFWGFYFSLHHSSGEIGSAFSLSGIDVADKSYGFSVRCIKN